MEDDTCEVCTDTLDATDSSISFCDCNYAVCLWCAPRPTCVPVVRLRSPGSARAWSRVGCIGKHSKISLPVSTCC